jgi:ubiquinone/menaquinone biosynthesis C-methylase UbiE
MRNDSSDVSEFDKWSRNYEQSWSQALYFDRIHRAVLDLVAYQDGSHVPVTILDIGCGTGRLLRKAGQIWPMASLVGVDPSQGMLEVARRLVPGATFHVASAESLPLADASVDVAMTTMSLHHWKDQAAGVREIARVLRPGGRFCLADATLPVWLARLVHHMEGNSFAAWRALVEPVGLSVAAQERRFLGHVLLMLIVK